MRVPEWPRFSPSTGIDFGDVVWAMFALLPYLSLARCASLVACKVVAGLAAVVTLGTDMYAVLGAGRGGSATSARVPSLQSPSTPLVVVSAAVVLGLLVTRGTEFFKK